MKVRGGWSLLVFHRKVRKDRKGFYCPGFALLSAANRHNIHFAPPDRRIPMHPSGTIKAPASPRTTRAAEQSGMGTQDE